MTDTILRSRDASGAVEGSFTVKFSFDDGTTLVKEADRLRLAPEMGMWELIDVESRPLLVRMEAVVGIEVDGYAR